MKLIKILVIEDNSTKAKRICELLSTIPDITEENIQTVQDQITARRFLMSEKFTIVILDVQIPVRFEQDPEIDGGANFLRDLYSSNKMVLPDYILGVTAHEKSYQSANPIFDEKLWALIKYDEASDEWSQKILSYVKRIIDTKKSEDHRSFKQYDYDLGIVCALNDVELESIKRLSHDWEMKYGDDGVPYYCSVFQNDTKKIKVVAAAAPQMGMTATAVLTTNMIHQFTPKYLAMTGIAAGVTGKVGLGDILVADPSWDYGNGKVIDDDGTYKFQPDVQQIRLDRDLRAKFEQIRTNNALLDQIKRNWPGETPSTELNIKIGPVASGASVLANSQVSDAIKEQGRNIVGIEMEAYGFYYAAENCSKPRPKAFAIKSVCDFASKEKNDNFQRFAAYTSASILHYFVMNQLEIDVESFSL